jgi:hypothetical protein
MFRNACPLVVFAILSPAFLTAQTVPPTRNPSPVKNSPGPSTQRPTARQAAQPSTSNQTNPAPDFQSSVSSMHKLSPTTGWVSDGSHLLLTTDNGAHWADISPPNQDGDSYAGVIFADVNHGWVLIAHSDDSEKWSFSVARTSDAGGSWTEAALPAYDYDPSKGEPGLSSTGNISFSDAQHGWISLDVQGNTVFAWSTLLSTTDGSTWTWVEAGSDGHSDGINAVTANDIWIKTRSGAELDVSHDGGATFQPLSLPNPANTSPSDAIYELPHFSDSLNGYEVVNFKTADNSQSVIALFVTADGGQTWHQDRLLTNLDLGTEIPTAVAGSTWIIPFAAQGSTPTIIEVSTSGTTAAPANQVGDVSRCNISFAAPADGWISCPNGLSTTSDTGSTWVDITPSSMKEGDTAAQPVNGEKSQPAASNLNAKTSTTKAKTSTILGNPSDTPAPRFTSAVTERLSFDTNHVPTPNMMQKWWNSSPYYAVGIYLPGGPSNSTYGAVLNQQWVTDVAAEGWGFIPIWSGPQAPCACRYGGTYPSCKSKPGHTSYFPSRFDWDPTIAESEGESQAGAGG